MNKKLTSTIISNKLFLQLLAFVFAITIAISIFYLIHPISSSNLNFSKFAYFFAHGEGWKLFSVDDRCVITPFLASSLVRFGFAPYTAVYIIGSIFFTFTIIPLFFILRSFVGPFFSSIGCVMYAVTPMFVVGFNQIQVYERNLFILAATALLFALKNKTYLKLILFGICLGALVLIRPKSILFVICFLSFYFLISYKKEKIKIILNYTIIFVCLGFVIFPGIYQVYEYTGYPGLTLKQAAFSKRLLNLVGCRKKGKAINEKIIVNKKIETAYKRLAESKIQEKQIIENDKELQLKNGKSRAKYFDIPLPRKSFFDSYIAVFIGNLFDFNAVYLILLFCGMILAFKEKKWSNKHSILGLIALLNIFICYKYSMERVQYASLNILLLFPLIIYGLKAHMKWLNGVKMNSIYKYIFFVVAILIMFLFSLINTGFR